MDIYSSPHALECRPVPRPEETMFRRSITFPQMAVAMCLGTAGGVYIYGPYYRRQNPAQDQAPAGVRGEPAAEQAPVLPPPEPQSKDAVE
ncbi:unnamed protein product [Arctogadus glacialis]